MGRLMGFDMVIASMSTHFVLKCTNLTVSFIEAIIADTRTLSSVSKF
jgi:Na+-translocating ferredoxin:NAD+ oxidoreductase RnfE subunit